jgi:hypothetical protein
LAAVAAGWHFLEAEVLAEMKREMVVLHGEGRPGYIVERRIKAGMGRVELDSEAFEPAGSAGFQCVYYRIKD